MSSTVLILHGELCATTTCFFKMCSRQGARMHALKVRHSLPPFLTFGLVKNPDTTLAALSRMCASMLGSFTRDFLAFRGRDQVSRDAQAALTLISLMVRGSTVLIENSNAGMQHITSVASCHVRMPDLEMLSANRLLQKMRTRSAYQKKP